MNSSTRKPVVVGVDGSAAAVHAVRWAAHEAHRRSTQIRIVYADVMSLVHLPDMPTQPLPVPFAKAAQRQGQEWLKRASEVAKSEIPDLVVDTEVQVGQPAAVLIGHSRDAQLVVVGSRGLGGFTGLMVGSVAIALSAQGHCPVAMVRGPESGSPAGPVVVGVDRSEANEAALTTAFECASQRNVPLHVVCAWNSVDTEVAWWKEGAGWDAVQIHEEQVLAEHLAGWVEKFPGLDVRSFVSHDKPGKLLLQHAGKAQLAVVGARGRGGFKGLLLGSVSQKVLQHSPCPVIVARS